jgi:hypothetical protein
MGLFAAMERARAMASRPGVDGHEHVQAAIFPVEAGWTSRTARQWAQRRGYMRPGTQVRVSSKEIRVVVAPEEDFVGLHRVYIDPDDVILMVGTRKEED